MKLEEQKILKRLRKAREDQSHEQLAVQYNKLGDLRMNEGQFDEALTAFKESLSSFQTLGDDLKIGCAHRMVGEAYVQLANWQKALKHQKIYLEHALEAGDKIEQQRAWASIGRAQICIAESKADEEEEDLRKKALSAAKNALIKSLEIANNDLNHLRKRDLVEMKARLMLNLGLVSEYQGFGSEALKKIEKAVDLCEANDLYEDLTRSMVSLGSLKLRQGDCSAALRDIGFALTTAKRLPSEEKTALTCDALVTQADVFFAMGDFSAAKHALHKAYKLKPSNIGAQDTIHKNLQIAVTALNAEKSLQDLDENEFLERKKLYEKVADCCVEMRAFVIAIEYYKKMLQCSETLGESGKELSAALVSLAVSYQDNKQYKEALEYFEREQELWADNPKESCRSFQEIAIVLKLMGKGNEQLVALEKARMKAILAERPSLQLDVLQEIATYHRSNGNKIAADEIENEMLDLRRSLNSDSEMASSQEMGSSQEQDDDDFWENVNVDELSSDMSDDGAEKTKTARLRPRNQVKITKNEKGETALHRACIVGNLEQVKKLLEGKHPVNVRDNAGWIPLHEASNYGWRDIVEVLLDHGAHIDDKGGNECDGITPLHDAASNGSFDVIELLLDRGADVNARTYSRPRQTAYHYFVHWHKQLEKPLDRDEEMIYQQLCNRMKQAMGRGGLNNSKITSDSDSRHSGSFSALQNEDDSPEPVNRSPSPQASTSSSRRYESRAIMSLKKPRPNRILSSGVSSQSEDDIRVGIGNLRRKTDPPKKLGFEDDEEMDSRRSARSREQIKSSSSESDEEEERTQQPAKQAHDTGALEYVDVMKTLRGKHRFKGPELTRKYAKPALLAEDDVPEEWLEDDLPASSQPAKRKRVSSPDFSRSASTNSQKASQNKGSKSARVSHEAIEIRTPSPEVEAMDADVEDVPPLSPPRKKFYSPKKRSPQKKSPLKSINLDRISSYQQRSDQTPPASLKVRVNDSLLLVPVPLRDLTMSWLADEVALRYYKLRGLRPKLTLLTKDGAYLSPDDPVSLLLVNKDDEVLSKVDSLTLPPITERYKEACTNGTDDHLLSCLKSCQVTLALKLNNLCLDDQLTPLLQSLMRQSSLKELNLSGCDLEDEGIKKLCPVLETLEQLSSLDISSNNVTATGLAYIRDSLVTKMCLKELKCLNLNHNSLYSKGLVVLGSLLQSLSCLTKLQAKDCDLNIPENVPVDSLPMFNLDSLKELDVSFNPLGSAGLGYFFGRIDAWQMTELIVSYTNSPDQEDGFSASAREVVLLIQKIVQGDMPGGKFSHIDLSGCKLKDEDVYELLSSLSEVGVKVDRLTLSSNPSLTAVSLRYLLQPERCISCLSVTGCPQILFQLQATDIPHTLSSLKISAPNDQLENLIQIWRQSKGPTSISEDGIVENYVDDGSFLVMERDVWVPCHCGHELCSLDLVRHARSICRHIKKHL